MKPLTTTVSQLDSLALWPASDEVAGSHTTFEDNRVIVTVPAALNGKSAKQICGQIEAFAASGQDEMILDMSNVKSIDSAGIKILLNCLRQAYQQDAQVRVAAISPEAETVLELFGLEGAFGIAKRSPKPTLQDLQQELDSELSKAGCGSKSSAA